MVKVGLSNADILFSMFRQAGKALEQFHHKA